MLERRALPGDVIPPARDGIDDEHCAGDVNRPDYHGAYDDPDNNDDDLRPSSNDSAPSDDSRSLAGRVVVRGLAGRAA